MFKKYIMHTKNLFFLLLLSLLILLVLVATFSPYFAPYDPYMTSLAKKLLPASSEHLLGTDHLGRDVLSRLIYGLRISLLSVLIISSSIVTFALIVGSIAGYKGGLFDSILMRICDVFLTFPTFILGLFFIGVFGVGLFNVILTIILTHWAWYARIVRSLVLQLKSQGYVLAAKSAGSSDFKIIICHIIPSVLVQIVVLATLDFGHMIMHMAGLSFLGLGIQAPTAEWGVMISDAIPYIRENAELMLYPGFCIFLIVALFNSFGEVLRDKLDVQSYFENTDESIIHTAEDARYDTAITAYSDSSYSEIATPNSINASHSNKE